jgi:hypothetical protein
VASCCCHGVGWWNAPSPGERLRALRQHSSRSPPRRLRLHHAQAGRSTRSRSMTASSVIGSVNDRIGRRIAGASLLFVVGTGPPQATDRKAGRVDLASGLSGCWHGGCYDLIRPRAAALADYATAASRLQQNSVPSRHIRCNTTASLRATATLARRMPARLAAAMPQALSADHCLCGSAARWRLRRAPDAPERRPACLLICPTRSVSLDW